MIKGLYFGKFAPFHIGHERVIKEAVKRVDKLFVLVYDHPHLLPISVERRAKWISLITASPMVLVVPVYEYPASLEQHNLLKASILGHQKIDKVFCNERWGAATANFFNAELITIDRQRAIHPVAGSEIRESPSSLEFHKDNLHPMVYEEMIALYGT